jgi:hypothetical protein
MVALFPNFFRGTPRANDMTTPVKTLDKALAVTSLVALNHPTPSQITSTLGTTDQTSPRTTPKVRTFNGVFIASYYHIGANISRAI